MCSAVKRIRQIIQITENQKEQMYTQKDKKLPKAKQALPAVQLKDRRLFAIISNQTKRRAYYCPGQVLRTGTWKREGGGAVSALILLLLAVCLALLILEDRQVRRDRSELVHVVYVNGIRGNPL